MGYLFKSRIAFFPLIFLFVFVVGRAIASWRKLRVLESAHPTAVYENARTSIIAPKAIPQEERANPHQYIWALTKPRRIRLKPVPRALIMAFPASWIVIAYFGYLIARNQVGGASPFVAFGDLAIFVFFALVWSALGITTIRSARRDRKLLAEGNIAMGTVTRQELSRGKHQTSQIQYEFKDATGRRIYGDGTDQSRELYEDMEVPVFYDPDVPTRNVALCAATCELITD
ncbi:MAG TPA: DUF3592 domain-containing protein [Candidatus Acidoferrum sp.]|nr:DUF3592 domain-containing protein [Candidatus Acidoferrum sp.]